MNQKTKYMYRSYPKKHCRVRLPNQLDSLSLIESTKKLTVYRISYTILDRDMVFTTLYGNFSRYVVRRKRPRLFLFTPIRSRPYNRKHWFAIPT